MQSTLQTISDRLYSAFSIGTLTEKLAAGLVNLLVASVVFAAFWLLWLILRSVIATAFKRANSDATTTSFMLTALKFALLTIGAVTALDSAGIKTSAVLTSLGIVGLTVGFAAKDALSNLISGVLIFLDRPFVIDDLVEIDGRYGRVHRITLRSTRIITNDGKMLAVPNTEIINRIVTSYTNYPNLRLDIAVNIGVHENIARVREILLGLIQDQAVFMQTPAPRVVVLALNDYNIALELQAWVYKEREHVEHRYALREAIFNALNDAGVEMPLETLQLAPFQVQSGC